MTLELVNLIVKIRTAASIEEERHIISTELANIRTYIRDCDPELRPRIITKLVYLNMMGETTSWGWLETINLMADDRFSFKRHGYLGASLLLDETAEVTVLLTHTLKKDLQSKFKFVVGLALDLLANIGSPELCRSLASDVQKVLQSEDHFLRKRAAMSVVRIVKKIPEFTETFQPHVHHLLNDPSRSVVLAGVGMVVTMLKVQPDLARSWAKFTPAFVKILRSLISSSRNSESASEPFLQVRVLEVLSFLKSPSDDLDEVLAGIVSTADMRRSDGRAILLQAVQTIVAVGKKASLRTLAFNQIGRLLSFRESNILYSALNVFSRVLYANRDILDRTSSDSLALQRYKSQIVRCLDDPDISIRRRALDVISALIDADNIERLVPEILKYLHLADTEFRIELVGRIFSAIQRFSSNEQWTFNVIIQILRESGGYVKSDIITAACNLVSQSQTMQTYAVQKLEAELTDNATVQPLVQVAAWILGEYGTQNIAPLLGQILTLPQTKVETKGYIITAMAKLASRDPNNYEYIKYIQENTSQNNLDLQQRAGECIQLLTRTNVADQILAPIPKPEVNEPASASKSTEQKHMNLMDWNPIGNIGKSTKPVDLLDSLLNSIPSTTAKSIPPNQMNNNTGNNSYMDLLSSQGSSNKSNHSNVLDLLDAHPTPKNNQNSTLINLVSPGAIEVFSFNTLKVYFEVKKSGSEKIAIRTTSVNTGNYPISSFKIDYAAPSCWASKMDPPSGNSIQPNGSVQQVTYWLNKGNEEMSMKINITLSTGGDIMELSHIIQPSVFN